MWLFTMMDTFTIHFESFTPKILHQRLKLRSRDPKRNLVAGNLLGIAGLVGEASHVWGTRIFYYQK